MTVATIRPNATDSNTLWGFAAGGTGSAHAATADELDTSYVDSLVGGVRTLVLGLGTSALPAGAVTKTIQMDVRVRGNTFSATTCTVEAGASVLASVAPVTTGLGQPWAPASTGPQVATLSQAQIDALQVRLLTTNVDQQVSRVSIDLVYVAKPVTAVTAVTPDPYTASNIVPIAWSNTLDSDGGGQTRYHVRVLTDAQYGAIDPGAEDSYLNDPTTADYWNSGEIVGSSLTVYTGALATADTYRAYVRVAQTVNGVAHWSAWAYDTFTVDVDTADVASITAAPHDALARIQIDVERVALSEAWQFIEVERSLDAGTTWTPVRFATYVDATGDADSFQVFDYEVGNARNVIYRARATRLLSTLPITGEWVQTAAVVAWSSDDFWLKAPLDPTMNMTVKLTRMIAPTRPRRRGVFNVIGAATPVVVSDVMSSTTGVLDIWTHSTDPTPEDLLEEFVVLLHSPPEWDLPADYYLATGGVDHVRGGTLPEQRHSRWVTDFVEVAAPADPTAGQ